MPAVYCCLSSRRDGDWESESAAAAPPTWKVHFQPHHSVCLAGPTRSKQTPNLCWPPTNSTLTQRHHRHPPPPSQHSQAQLLEALSAVSRCELGCSALCPFTLWWWLRSKTGQLAKRKPSLASLVSLESGQRFDFWRGPLPSRPVVKKICPGWLRAGVLWSEISSDYMSLFSITVKCIVLVMYLMCMYNE